MRSTAFRFFFAILLGYVIAEDVSIITVATEDNDALQRFMRSANHSGFDVKILGLNDEWVGGDMSNHEGGGQKVNLLKRELSQYKDDDRLILFVDSYDVIIVDKKERLLEEYRKIGKNVLFGAEDFCWPDKALENLYPVVPEGGKRFLNSGGFIGPASALYKIVTVSDITDTDDDQLYYTNIFLDEAIRTELDIGLDTEARIFQNLHGAFEELELKFTDDTGYLVNTRTNSQPIVIHGNGPIKPEFNLLANYLDHNWTPTRGCQQCQEGTIDLDEVEEIPIIQLSIFIERPTPFLDVFFERIAKLAYPKDRIHLTGFITPQAEMHRKLAEEFNMTHGHEYRTCTWFAPGEIDDSGSARNVAYAYCLANEQCQFLLSITGAVQLTSPNTIEHLVRMNRSMLAPLVTRRGKLWSNFWGALSSDGYYERSDDYVDIIERKKRGIWNVPLIRDVYIMSRPTVRKMVEAKFTGSIDLDMKIAKYARSRNIFMFVDNQWSYGYLTFEDNYSVDHLHNDLWQIFDNQEDWEEKYIHPDYFELLSDKFQMSDFKQPCPDVFYFPLVTEKFAKELIEETEHFGQWSDGSNQDSRLEGGYENVPTRDIHMRQLNWEDHWLHFLVKYIHPIQKKLFQGYDDKPWARMNFVVRYRPDEQPYLRPHQDASSFSLILTLNRPGIDFQGGGTRFIRYNCSITSPDVGWVSMFPGRVTHLHEGLATTSGTRYIFVTFVNP